MIRLFAAFAVPEDVRLRLSGLRGQIPGARWVQPENMHVTLRFVGEVDNHVADDVHDALERVAGAPPEIRVRGVGHFDSRSRVRALWAGVARTDALAAFQARVEAACVRAGLPAETRRFHPHITLARCRDTRVERITPFLEEHAGLDVPAFTPDAFTLYSSALGRAGPVYTPEVEYPLGAAFDAHAWSR